MSAIFTPETPLDQTSETFITVRRAVEIATQEDPEVTEDAYKRFVSHEWKTTDRQSGDLRNEMFRRNKQGLKKVATDAEMALRWINYNISIDVLTVYQSCSDGAFRAKQGGEAFGKLHLESSADENFYLSKSEIIDTIYNIVTTAGRARPPMSLGFAGLVHFNFHSYNLPPGYIAINDALEAFMLHIDAYSKDDYSRNVADLQNRFRASLNQGDLRTYFVGSGSKVHILKSSDWRAGGPIISEVFKKEDSYWEVDEEGTRRNHYVKNVWRPYILAKADGKEDHGSVVVLVSELMQFLCEITSDIPGYTEESNANHVVANKGGRPKEHNAEAFLLEAFSIIYEGPEPKSQAELIDKTLRAYMANGMSEKPPSSTWIKQRLSPLCRKLGIGQKGP